MGAPADQPTAIVIGAGVGGVATAARLAKAGFRVTVVEKNDYTGGRCSLIRRDGYRFDQGPSLLLLPRLFAETFADLDTSLAAEGVQLLKCEPNYNLWFGDGVSFELSTDLARMKAEVERWEGPDGFARYLAWLREAHVHYEASVVHVLRKNFPSLAAMVRPSFLLYLRALHPFESVWSRASRYFRTERLRRVFTFGSMYMGMSPFDAPGTYSLLQYTELAEGIWYPRGGFHKVGLAAGLRPGVVEALVAVGQRFGVEYRLSTAVGSVLLSPDGREARGVVLESGEQLTADVVVVNADLVYAYRELLPPSRDAQQLSKRAASCSSISFYWAMDRLVPELRTHNIFLADAYRESFDDIFQRQRMPAQPSFYVNVPSRVDGSAAPAGKDAIVVLVPVGHLLESEAQDWPATIARARATVIETIEARTGARGLAAAILHETVNSPLTWQAHFNLDKGAILGLSHSFFNVLAFRPRTRHPSIDRCFFVGASTHPGTGVPICLAGSKITAEQILHRFGIGTPWGEDAARPARTTRVAAIDRVTRAPLFSRVHVVLALALVLLAFALDRFVLPVRRAR
ncbi:MAG: hypothetical protein M1826_007374 [Phylliscum demangeonii]|nr:MAG: hypothetical protein M1826_007374 [Phylliscum demangeonii]